MKKIIFAVTLFLSINAEAQIYDIVRSVNNFSGYIQGTKSGDYTHTGTMIIDGNKIKRTHTVCEDICKNFIYNDEILFSTDYDYRAIISGDSGDLVSIEILSLSPTIIILQEKFGLFEIEEYKPR